MISRHPSRLTWYRNRGDNPAMIHAASLWRPYRGDNLAMIHAASLWRPHRGDNPAMIHAPSLWRPHRGDNLVMIHAASLWRPYCEIENNIKIDILIVFFSNFFSLTIVTSACINWASIFYNSHIGILI